jgi:hypothetical protein
MRRGRLVTSVEKHGRYHLQDEMTGRLMYSNIKKTKTLKRVGGLFDRLPVRRESKKVPLGGKALAMRLLASGSLPGAQKPMSHLRSDSVAKASGGAKQTRC